MIKNNTEKPIEILINSTAAKIALGGIVRFSCQFFTIGPKNLLLTSLLWKVLELLANNAAAIKTNGVVGISGRIIPTTPNVNDNIPHINQKTLNEIASTFKYL